MITLDTQVSDSLRQPRLHEPVFIAGVLGPAQCAALCAIDEDSWNHSRVSNDLGAKTPQEAEASVESALIRSADEANVPDTCWQFVHSSVIERIRSVNDETYGFALSGLANGDGTALLRYEANRNGHFWIHRDVGPAFSTRKLSFSVQLTSGEEYVGGDLRFPYSSVEAPRDKGTLSVFPAYLPHVVTAVRTGVRHALVGWIHGPAFQ